VNSLIAAHQRGVNVVVFLDEVQAADGQADEALQTAGVHVILADATGSAAAEMHSKFLVVDHAHVVMGSYNWTNLGSFYNDENVVMIQDTHLASRVEGKLALLVDTYNASPSALGLTTGSQAVTFALTNVTVDPGLDVVIRGDGPLAQGVPFVNGVATVAVPAGTRLTYHYEIESNGQMLTLEAGSHAFTVPFAPGPFAVSDAFTP
jgi:hypothetical protein